MNSSLAEIFRRALLALTLVCGATIRGADAPTAERGPEPTPATAPASEATPEATPAAPTAEEAAAPDTATPGRSRGRQENPRVSLGMDVELGAGEYADVLVAVMGSATNAGEVGEAMVAVAGNARTTGPVGAEVVAVLGNVYVNNRIDGDVVAVVGGVELGPEARVRGDVVAVGGRVTRQPGAETYGEVQSVPFLPTATGIDFDGLQQWFRRAVLLGRPLAIGPGLGWVWVIAGSFLALYVVLALLFRGGMERCLETLDTRPGSTVIAALLAMLLSPVLLILLLVTVIGAILVPFFGLALLIASFFGKAVVLAWLGSRIIRAVNREEPLPLALAVFLGGLLALGLYLIPFVGFVFYKLFGILGLGVVVNTIIIGSRREKAAAAAAAASAAAAMPRPGIVSPPPAAPVPSAPVLRADVPASANVSPGFVGADPAHIPPVTPPPVYPLPPPPIPTTTLPRAGFWIRIGALTLDVIIVAMILTVLWWVLPEKLEFELNLPRILFFLAVYGAILWKLKGTTIGGIICGLQVVRVDGRPMDWATVIVRALSCFLSLVVVGLGFIWVVIDEEKQSWHDKIAGTLVVRVPKGITLI